jgi:CBS domain-containing protein
MSSLDHIHVGDCMHRGILACDASAPLEEVASIMAKHRVHAVAVTDGGSNRPTAVVSALDVVAAADCGAELSASQVAATEFVSVSGDESLTHAAKLMTEYGISHLIVLDAASGYPAGILSTLDVMAVQAGASAAERAPNS